MIPHAFLQDLLNRVDIVEVVGCYVQLKKAGTNFTGLCPFHHEKSPSFTISPSKQFYHCFGCGAHGTAISFLMEHGGFGFREAVAELAQGAGLAVPEEPGLGYRGANGSPGATRPAGEQRRASTGLADVLRVACDYYRKQLRNAPAAIDYLRRRGLTGEVAARFGLGYAPAGWQNLEAVFPAYHDDRLVEAGLVIVSEKGQTESKRGADGQVRRYDRFRERVMFPIRNVRGQVIGFGGRVLGTGEPKYLNSPETPLFNKGSELYGLFEARQAIRDMHYALVVEGYMDVVALAQLGFANAVATLGTACSVTHVQKLLCQTDTVIFSFDGDAAGRRAARRALEACLPHAGDNRAIRFLFLPTQHDPDSFIREQGSEAFADAVAQAVPLSQFLLAEVLGGKALDQPEGRAKALFEARPLLQALPVNALRAQIVHLLADRLEMPHTELATLCELGDAPRPSRQAPKRPPPVARRRVLSNEQRALRILVMHPALATQLDEQDLATLAATRQRALFDEVIERARALGEGAQFRVLVDWLRTSAQASVFEELLHEILSFEENVRDLMADDDAGRARVIEQERIAAEELRAALVRMRYEACCQRLDRLSRQGVLNSEESAEFADLLRQRADLKRQLGL